MTARTAVQAFAAATHAVVEQRDVHDVLAQLLGDCLEVLGADAIGVLVVVGGTVPGAGHLELLAATSHDMHELELYQVQAQTGPCPEAISTGAPVRVGSRAELLERWDGVGRAIVEAGFRAVDAYPLVWQGRVLGGFNVFRRGEGPARHEEGLGQAFADVVSMLLVRSPDLTLDDVSARVREVIAGRAVIEQAKGVLAYLDQLEMSAAYRRLTEIAAQRGLTLSAAAEWVVAQAVR